MQFQRLDRMATPTLERRPLDDEAANPRSPRGPLAIAEWLLLVAAAGYFCFFSFPRAWARLDTDFPNYYVTARLLRDGYDTHRIYEWTWLQRQKDRLGIDQPVVEFIPLTPFSALVMWPLAHLAPLIAKHAWIVVNLLLLAAIAILLRNISGLPWKAIVLLMLLSVPLQRNLQYGQYYILLLALIILALWLYLRDRRFLAGLLLAAAVGLKIFPALFALYFVRKRDTRAFLGLAIGIAVVAAVSIAAFGVELHRLYLAQILPAALRGEAIDPYNLRASSISALLHRLFIAEPDLNPHPLLHAPTLVAVLQPLLHALTLAPAILLAAPLDWSPNGIRLEWSALVVALLTISTMPASYHFVFLLLPVTVLASVLLEQKRYGLLAFVIFLYLAIGYPNWRASHLEGWLALLAAPRLYCMLLLCGTVYFVLQKWPLRKPPVIGWVWPATLSLVAALQMFGMLHHQRGVYAGYGARVANMPAVFLATNPAPSSDLTYFIALRSDGYHTAVLSKENSLTDRGRPDRLALSAASGRLWVEEAGSSSRVVGTANNQVEVVEPNAEAPVASPDGHWLAYLRSDHGRARVWLRSLRFPGDDSHPVTPAELNVLEMTYLSDGTLAFSALNQGRTSLFFADHTGVVLDSGIHDVRYPAVSPDGQHLAYSRLHRGTWNLWLRELGTGQETRITNADCNDLSPAWLPDSKTLLYASDCGRGLWLTALQRKRVVP